LYLEDREDKWAEALTIDVDKGDKMYNILGTIVDYDFLLCSKVKQHMRHDIVFFSKIRDKKVQWVLAIAFFNKIGRQFRSKGWEPKHEVDKMLSEIARHPNVEPWKEIDTNKLGIGEVPY